MCPLRLPSDHGAGITHQRWAERLYTDHWDELVRLARRALFRNAREFAEDLVGDVLGDIAAGKFSGLPPTHRRVVAFARAVLRNRAVVVNRREARRSPLPGEQLTTAGSVDAWRAAHQALLRRDVANALALLTPREREIATLHWLDGWPVPALAKELGIATRTVKELLRRARPKLCAALADHRRRDGRGCVVLPHSRRRVGQGL